MLNYLFQNNPTPNQPTKVEVFHPNTGETDRIELHPTPQGGAYQWDLDAMDVDEEVKTEIQYWRSVHREKKEELQVQGKCFQCLQLGHIMRKCPNSYPAEDRLPTPKSNPTPDSGNMLQGSTSIDSHPPTNQITSKVGLFITQKPHNWEKITPLAIIDSGSTHNAINIKYVKQHHIPYSSTNQVA